MLRSKVLRPVCERRKGSIQWRGGACASALLHLVSRSSDLGKCVIASSRFVVLPLAVCGLLHCKTYKKATVYCCAL